MTSETKPEELLTTKEVAAKLKIDSSFGAGISDIE
jgi:hypothetical protein